MSETARLGLPLVQPSQAQKHVTVNEALSRIDAVAQMALVSRSVAVPPAPVVDGAAYAVPVGAAGDWAGEEGKIAVGASGGWMYLVPVAGWRAWVADEGSAAVFDGTGWVQGAVSVTAHGAGLIHRTVEIDHAVAAGASSTTATVIPSHALVYGVTGRVISEITGTASGWQIGIAGVSPDRYGTGYGTGVGAWARGLTSSPLAYFEDTALTLTAEGGSFAGGTVRLAVHLAELTLPRA